MLNSLKVSTEKPIEHLVGDNYGIVRLRCGNIHCMTPIREVIRELKPANWNQLPRPLKRGFLLCVIETMSEYRDTYKYVMGGL